MFYFRGCVAREKLQNIGNATEEILMQAGVDYKILENEKCCGSFLLRTGFVDEAREVMENTLKEIGEEKVLVSCAGCYKTFKKDYKELLDVEIDVIHTSKLFNQLIENGKMDLEYADKKVTYHDPCHLGRQMDEYDVPRDVISKAANLVEMKRNREKSRCCGAGAGVRSAYPEITEEIAKSRLDDAENINVETIITSCPFCILNLNSACLDTQNVLDLAEFVLKSLKNHEAL